MKSDLPPLIALTAFEAAGRLQSFTLAARQLNVTQAAVSRQIRLLEEHIGKKLFVRAHRSVELTAEGRNYLHTVATALSHVSAATRELRSAKGDPVMTLAADQSIAHLWLMSRLAAFRQDWPGLSINVTVSDSEELCLAPPVDLAIIHGAGHWASHESALLFGEEVFPVCSPNYRGGGGSWPNISALARETLLDLDDDHWNWMNWRQWLNGHGVGTVDVPKRLTINNYPLLIDAARRGLGVALGWRGLVDDDLAAGRLVTPLRASLKTHFGYYAVWPRDHPRSPAIFALIDAMRGENG